MPAWIESTGYLAAYGMVGSVLTLTWLWVVIQWKRSIESSLRKVRMAAEASRLATVGAEGPLQPVGRS